MAKRLTPGYIEPYAAGLLLAQLVWRDPNRRSDAMVYMRIAYDKGDLRGDWKPSYPPGKGKVHEGDLRVLAKQLLQTGTERRLTPRQEELNDLARQAEEMFRGRKAASVHAAAVQLAPQVLKGRSMQQASAVRSIERVHAKLFRLRPTR